MEIIENPKVAAGIFSNMRERLNNYWANLASKAIKDDFERDMLFDADMHSRELRKRIKIKHLL
jgi:hypothetical protein